jgi:hypothetical protein
VTDTRWQLVAYVFVSIILRMVAAQLFRRRMNIAWVRFLSEGWAASVLRFVYYIGLPYIALVLGVVPTRYLGLVGFDWLQVGDFPGGLESGVVAGLRDYLSLVLLNWLPGVGTIAGLGVVMLLFLSLMWWGYAHFRGRVVADLGIGTLSPREETSLGVMQVIYQAVHWSFYRGAIWLLTDDLYLGVTGGIILVGVEWMLDPGWVKRLRRPLAGEMLLIDASVLIASAVIFFFVPNLWLLIPIHWLLAAVSRRIVGTGQLRVAGSG